MNHTSLWLFAAATFISTISGGIFSLKFRNKIYFILAFTAGVLIGVFTFDILPEIIKLINDNKFDTTGVMIAFAFGFITFHILEKVILIHHTHEEEYAEHKHPDVGVLSALALIGHSFMDGVGIGLGFQISNVVGILVSLAIITHDFTDGMNTVSLMLIHRNSPRKTLSFLLVDAIAPVLGAFSTLFFEIPNYYLVLYLGFFGGFLVYIGASDILPEAHSNRSSFKLIGLTILGLFVTFIIGRMI